VPGNDRLIVLISDGADWKPKGSEDAGELVRGVDEPVSLMEDLHQRMRIHLHALGISTEEIFWSWWKRRSSGTPHASAVPNHKLLEAMVEVGGGDPTRTGDAEVLADYFSGLGRGVSRRLSPPRAAEPLRPRDDERAGLRERIAQLGRNQAGDRARPERTDLGNEVLRLYNSCNEHARSLAGRDLFLASSDSVVVLGKLMFEPVGGKRDFDWWWGKLHQQFWEARDIRIRDDKQSYPIAAVKELFQADETRDLNHLRNWCSHSWLSPGNEPERKEFDKNLKRLRRILEQMIGRAALEEEDEEAWSGLQLAVLDRLRGVLRSLVQPLREEGSRPPVASPVPAAATAAPARIPHIL